MPAVLRRTIGRKASSPETAAASALTGAITGPRTLGIPYALALAGRGYDVTLVDLSERLLERARIVLSDAGVSAVQFVCADACDLSKLPGNHFDAGLPLGPLYHLVDRSRRLAALGEFRRVLKAGGIGIVAYLNSWGILRCGLGDFPERYADLDFTRSLLGEKTFHGSFQGFTESYWATPTTALDEVAEAGLELVSYCGAEGFAGECGR